MYWKHDFKDGFKDVFYKNTHQNRILSGKFNWYIFKVKIPSLWSLRKFILISINWIHYTKSESKINILWSKVLGSYLTPLFCSVYKVIKGSPDFNFKATIWITKIYILDSGLVRLFNSINLYLRLNILVGVVLALNAY